MAVRCWDIIARGRQTRRVGITQDFIQTGQPIVAILVAAKNTAAHDVPRNYVLPGASASMRA